MAKYTKATGKVGFTLCAEVESFLKGLSNKGFDVDRLVQACESNLNDYTEVESETETKYGAVTSKAKVGMSQIRYQTSGIRQNKLDKVNAFLDWHDFAEKSAAKLEKRGMQLTIVKIPDGVQFADWIMGFVKPDAKTAKASKKQDNKTETASEEPAKHDLSAVTSDTAVNQ